MTDRWIVSWGLGAVAFGAGSLLVPLYIVHLGATPFHLGLLAAGAAFAGAPGAIVFGNLASRVPHRRRLVLLTLGLTALTLGIIPLLESITAVILVNALLWFVVSGVGPVVTMMIVENAAETEWSTRIGLLNQAHGYGWAVGLLLGMVWPLLGTQVFDPVTAERVLFMFLAAISVISTVTAWVTLPKPTPAATPFTARQARRITRLLATSRRGVRGATFGVSVNRLYWATRESRFPRVKLRLDSPLYRLYVAAGLFFAGFAVFWAPLPHFLAEIGFASGPIFALYLLSSLSAALLYERTGTLAQRVDHASLTGGALVLRGLLFPVVAVGAALGASSLGIALLGGLLLAIGVTWAVVAVVGSTMVTQLAPKANRATALGSYVAIGAVTGGAGSVIGGWLATYWHGLAFSVAGVLVIVGASIVFTLRQPLTP